MKLYVGTYYKYNCGSIEGKWLDLDDYTDKEEFLTACKEVHKDEQDPEFMFQDWEGESWEKSLYSECSVPEEYWEIKDGLEKSSIDKDIFGAWLTITNEDASVENIEKAEEQYCGKYESGEEYAEMEFEDTYKDSPLLQYVDWERVWRDMSFNGMEEEDGYIFDKNR